MTSRPTACSRTRGAFQIFMLSPYFGQAPSCADLYLYMVIPNPKRQSRSRLISDHSLGPPRFSSFLGTRDVPETRSAFDAVDGSTHGCASALESVFRFDAFGSEDFWGGALKSRAATRANPAPLRGYKINPQSAIFAQQLGGQERRRHSSDVPLTFKAAIRSKSGGHCRSRYPCQPKPHLCSSLNRRLILSARARS